MNKVGEYGCRHNDIGTAYSQVLSGKLGKPIDEVMPWRGNDSAVARLYPRVYRRASSALNSVNPG